MTSKREIGLDSEVIGPKRRRGFRVRGVLLLLGVFDLFKAALVALMSRQTA